MEIVLRGRADVNFEPGDTPIGPIPGVIAGDALYVKCRSNTGDFTEVDGWQTRSLKAQEETGVREYIATRIATGDSGDNFAPGLSDGASSRMSMWAWGADDDSPLQFETNAEAVGAPFDFIQASRSNSDTWAAGSFTPTSNYVAEVVFAENTASGDTATDLDGWNASRGSSTGYLWWRTIDGASGSPSNPTVTWSGGAYGPISHFMLSAAGAVPPDSDGEDSDADTASDEAGSDTGGGGASAAEIWNYEVEPGYTAADLLRICAAVLAGRTTITSHGGGAATVEFRSVTDDHVVLSVEMLNSERVTTTANP